MVVSGRIINRIVLAIAGDTIVKLKILVLISEVGILSKHSDNYRVEIRHNLVVLLKKVDDGDPEPDNLSAGRRLATAYQENGCIDGDYDFTSINKAKDFAILSLDFVKRLAGRNLENLQKHNFFSDPTWKNPLIL